MSLAFEPISHVEAYQQLLMGGFAFGAEFIAVYKRQTHFTPANFKIFREELQAVTPSPIKIKNNIVFIFYLV